MSNELITRTRARMAARGIPVGTDNPTLLALGARPLPDRTTRCWGTGRYAVRCRRLSRPGELTCGLHKHQDVSSLLPREGE